ncbi:MAG TPA: class I SAM-dependent RNA methyltransferase [Myxococcales bacterium]|jgi:23S rRNA (uracil1939-C5)-methyltransferase|nr:class I SAM-dependent RNA methyltransferase [Myxococcales bacterium]
MTVLLHIESLGFGGEAIARLDGRVVFVPGGVPGEVVEGELVEVRERSARARILRVAEPSSLRVEPECPHFPECGGCQWLQVAPAAQEKAKEQLFYDALERIGGLPRDSLQANPILTAGRHERYRTRTRLHLVGGQLGYTRRGSHTLVDVTQCRLLDQEIESALERLREAASAVGHVPRSTDVAFACDERRVAAAFYVAASSRAAIERVEKLLRLARLDGGVLVTEREPARTFGKPLLSIPAPCAPGLRLHGRPDLFAQANPYANELLVAEAMRLLGAPANVIELYGGAGNFTFAMTSRGARVTSVEISSSAVELARRSASHAGEGGARFIVGDSLRTGEALAKEGLRYDALVLDPPRTGAKGIAPLARQLGVRRVLYVSCDPATLGRDARELVSEGFRPVAATPVDMFPQTYHVEGLLLLEAA